MSQRSVLQHHQSDKNEGRPCVYGGNGGNALGNYGCRSIAVTLGKEAHKYTYRGVVSRRTTKSYPALHRFLELETPQNLLNAHEPLVECSVMECECLLAAHLTFVFRVGSDFKRTTLTLPTKVSGGHTKSFPRLE